MFTQVKAAGQSFVRDTVAKGQQSDLWRDLSGVQGPKRQPRRVQGGLAPDRAREVAAWLQRDGPVWWTLCCTGLGPREYWPFPREPLTGRWDVLPDRIVAHGTKREHRDRTIPRITTPVRPMIGYQAFRRRLTEAGRVLGIERLTPYVARRTFAHFLELAREIPDSRCDLYMGHSAKTDRAKYREHDVVPYLPEDTRALRQAVGPDPRYMRALA